MTKEEVWLKFCELNPSFKGESEVCVSPARIKKMVETSYKYGNEAGFEQGKRIASQLHNAVNRGGSQGVDLFNQIFNKK